MRQNQRVPAIFIWGVMRLKYRKGIMWAIGLIIFAYLLKQFGVDGASSYIQDASYFGMVYALVEWIEHKAHRRVHHNLIQELHEHLVKKDK